MAPAALSLPGSMPVRHGRLTPLRWLLVGLAMSTVAATMLLTVSVLALRPARVDLASWLPAAALFTAQGLLTLGMVAVRLRGMVGRVLLAAGGAAIGWMGSTWAWTTVSSGHFEGHALVLGTALAVQGALTIWDAAIGDA